MLDKLKDIGDQISSLASDTVQGATASVKEGADKVASATGSVAAVVPDKAVRTAVTRLREIVRIATEELLREPPSERPSTLTATVTVGITSLELTVELPGGPPAAKAEAPAQIAAAADTAIE